MSIAPDQGNTCWPSPEQELLLRAALLRGSAALDAWDAWRARVEISRLDEGSQRLLPLLWKNLENQGVDPDHPLFKPLRRSYRLTWGKNKVLFHTLTEQLRALHEAGFPTLLLKGAALTIRYFKDYGLRPMGDFDILVPEAQVEEAVRFLHSIGWLAMSYAPETFTQQYRLVAHAQAFENAAGWNFDLHWHVLDECCQPHADDDFWNGAERIDLDGVPTAVLNPADQMLHVCVHGLRWDHVPPLRWVADAMTVLHAARQSLDWDRLTRQTASRRLILPVWAALNYLRTVLEAPVPPAVLERLGNLATSRLERFEFSYRTLCHPQRVLGYLPLLWCKHSRMAGHIGLPAKLWQFIPFLQHILGAQHLRQLPRFLLSLGVRRVREAAGSSKR
jgi:hypothetical protein